MPDSWFHVPNGVIHRLLGVSIFSRPLELSGWNNVIVRPILKTEDYRPGTKASLAVRAYSARSGGGAHAICFALHVLLAASSFREDMTPFGAIFLTCAAVLRGAE
jgi:hypothetical protein